MKTLLKYTFWVAFAATMGLMYFNNAEIMTIVKTGVTFLIVWYAKKMFFNVKDRLAEKKLAMRYPLRIKKQTN